LVFPARAAAWTEAGLADGDIGAEEGGRETGYLRLAQRLRDEILEGKIDAGERLKVSDIARRFGTSTNPAREALQALEGEGLVVIAPNRGASVRPVTEDLVQNIFDIRSLLEPYITRGFVEYARPADVAALTRFQTGCEAAVARQDYPEFHRNNIRLHDYMIDKHPNLEAAQIMRKHNGWLRALSVKRPLTLAHMRRSNLEHWQLIEAVTAGDPDAAVRVIQLHMQNSRSVFLEGMRRARLEAERIVAD
jgi:DNA-binding GntR family transcriptional regulator